MGTPGSENLVGPIDAGGGGGGGAVDSVFGRVDDVTAAPGDYTASQVTNLPAGSISAVTVQAAINELDTTIPTTASQIANVAAGNISATDVQAAINELDTEKVAKAGDSMDASANITFSGGGEVLGLPASPSVAGSAASKAYVDALAQGLDPKASCRISSFPNANWTGTATADFVTGTGVLTISALTAGASLGLLDGIEPISTNRTLQQDMSTISALTTDGGAEATPEKYNGLWEVTGGTTTSLTLERTQDANTDAKVTTGLYTFIEEGTGIVPGNGFIIITPDPIIINTTAITFTQFSTFGPAPVTSVFGRVDAVLPVAGDYTGSEVTNVAAGNIVAVTTQAAIDELDTEKIAKAGDSMDAAANLTFSAGGEPLGLPATPSTGDAAISSTFAATLVPIPINDTLPVVTNGQTAFTISTAPNASASFKLFLEGILQTEGVDYTRIGTAVTWLDTVILTIGDDLRALYDDGASSIPIATKFQPAETNSNFGNLRVRSLTSTGNFNFNLDIPDDFGSLIEVYLRCSPATGAAGAAKDIDLSSEYGNENEPVNQHAESDIGTVYDFTGLTDSWTRIDISPVLTSISPGDSCGINVDNKTIGGAMRFTGIRLNYIRA